MKSNHAASIFYCFLGIFIACDVTRAQLDVTDEERAIPPAGEIKRLWLREVGFIHTDLTDALAGVPAGPDGQASTWFAKFQAFNSGLGTVMSSKLQSECFNLIPQMADLVTIY